MLSEQAQMPFLLTFPLTSLSSLWKDRCGWGKAFPTPAVRKRTSCCATAWQHMGLFVFPGQHTRSWDQNNLGSLSTPRHKKMLWQSPQILFLLCKWLRLCSGSKNCAVRLHLYLVFILQNFSIASSKVGTSPVAIFLWATEKKGGRWTSDRRGKTRQVTFSQTSSLMFAVLNFPPLLWVVDNPTSV